MPFKVETKTSVVWISADGNTDNSRFMIFRENGNLPPLIGTADWADGYPSYRLCLVQECWPANVVEAARRLLEHRGYSQDDLTQVRALILNDLEVGVPSIRIGLATGRYHHGIIDEHQTVLEGRVTGFEVVD
jgi:hypothetical protein